MALNKIKDKCRGSLVGGAIGDALGYEVEFLSLANIRKRFGEGGIADYVLHNGVAEFSDDRLWLATSLEQFLDTMQSLKSI